MSTGGRLHTAVQTAERLAADGIRARVLSMHTVKPLDEDAVLAAARDTGVVVTLEEHSIVGGLGSAVAECLGERSDILRSSSASSCRPRVRPTSGRSSTCASSTG